MKLRPKLYGIIRDREKDLSAKQIKDDVIAGIIVAIIALPLSVALAIASGVTPDKGLATAIVAGFFISLLGGSRVQIGGPTGAFVVIIYGIIQKYGLDGLLISTIMAGILLIIMGLMNLGVILKYIPFPTTTGFTTGIAIVLLSTQVKDFLGLSINKVPSEFFEKWTAYIKNIDTTNMWALVLGILSLLIIIYWPKVNKTIPGSLIALILITVLATAFKIPVETIGSRFGTIPSRLTFVYFSQFNITFDKIQNLIGPSITIAILAGIESLLSAVVADGMIGKKHNSNMELIAQGVANIASAFLGGIPATGAIARTSANVKNGGRTPIAGIVHAITLLLIMMVFMPLAGLIPMTVLGAILIVVSWNMVDFKAIKAILQSTKSDSLVFLATFLLTVIFDLVIAIEVGILLAMFLFVRKMTLSNPLREANKEYNLENDKDRFSVYTMEGPFFYGHVSNVINTLENLGSTIDTIILDMKNIDTIDITALRSLRELNDRVKVKKRRILLVSVNEKIRKIMDATGFTKRLGEDSFYNSTEEAIETMNKIA